MTPVRNRMKISNQTQPGWPDQPLDPRRLEFGRMFTPNFFVMEHRSGEWCNPRIQLVEPFTLHPASLVFQYAQTVVEGLKAFRQRDGRLVLFRPAMNAKRFQQSSSRLAMPPVDELTDVQYGRVPDRHGWVHDVCSADATALCPPESREVIT
jgi:branched-chain amino acid aminotransferase